MKNRFEAGFGIGLIKRQITRLTAPDPENGTQYVNYGQLHKQIKYYGSELDTNDMYPYLMIQVAEGFPEPRVKADGKGGFVVRPSRRFRKHAGAITIETNQQTDVYVSKKITVNSATSQEGASLSVPGITKSGAAIDAGIHVRGDAKFLRLMGMSDGKVDGYAENISVEGPGNLVTQTAKQMVLGSSDGRASKVKVLKGDVDLISAGGNTEIDVNGIIHKIEVIGLNRVRAKKIDKINNLTSDAQLIRF